MKNVKKYYISLLVLAVITFSVLALFFVLHAKKDDAVLVTDSRYQNYSDIKLIREITMTPDFPTFDSKTYVRINEKGEKEIILSCVFNPRIPEDSVFALSGKLKGGLLHQDSNGGMDFTRGWSKKKYMWIPDGVEEEMLFTLSMFCEDQNFLISYKKNPCFETVDKDSLNRYLGVILPEFEIINFISPDQTVIQFKKPISKETYRILEKNEWCEHKFDDDGTSMCWVSKKEPGEYSTWIEINDQDNTARLEKMKNN